MMAAARRAGIDTNDSSSYCTVIPLLRCSLTKVHHLCCDSSHPTTYHLGFAIYCSRAGTQQATGAIQAQLWLAHPYGGGENPALASRYGLRQDFFPSNT